MKIFIATALLILLALAGFSQGSRVIANRQKLYGSKMITTTGTAGTVLDTIAVPENGQRNVLVDITATAKGGQGEVQEMILVTSLSTTLYIALAKRQPKPWVTSGTLKTARYTISVAGNRVVIAGYGINDPVNWKVTKK